MNKTTDLPADLPVPVDDGACDHLAGRQLPALSLPSTRGGVVDLAGLAGRTVIYIYPMTGRPGVPLPDGWAEIPGAMGCTPQSCAFRDHHQELAELGAAVYGLSSQSTAYQQEAAERLQLPYALLSDEALAFANALSLPTLEVEGRVLIKRITLICDGDRIRHVIYPVFPPAGNAEAVLAWLGAHPAG